MVQVHKLSLLELMQAVQRATLAEPIPPDQRWLLLHMTSRVLEACAKGAGLTFASRDMQEIRGQDHVKRALEVAAAGGHNILLVGPPGAGKNLLVQAFSSLLPHTPVPTPFRQPHSSRERAAFLGETPFPDELMLAYGGVLFLKDLASFDRSWLSIVEWAVATRMIAANEIETYPAQFLLIATMKPCACGFYGDPLRECTCSVEGIFSYVQSVQDIAGSCFDIHIEVPIIEKDIMKMRPGELSSTILQRVETAREIQQKRYAQTAHLWVNADLHSLNVVQQYCQVDSSAEKLLGAARKQLYLTPLQLLQTLKVARTIADLANADIIAANHLAEAIQYRLRFGR